MCLESDKHSLKVKLVRAEGLRQRNEVAIKLGIISLSFFLSLLLSSNQKGLM